VAYLIILIGLIDYTVSIMVGYAWVLLGGGSDTAGCNLRYSWAQSNSKKLVYEWDLNLRSELHLLMHETAIQSLQLYW
jgi:hypothetical protein